MYQKRGRNYYLGFSDIHSTNVLLIPEDTGFIHMCIVKTITVIIVNNHNSFVILVIFQVSISMYYIHTYIKQSNWSVVHFDYPREHVWEDFTTVAVFTFRHQDSNVKYLMGTL